MPDFRVRLFVSLFLCPQHNSTRRMAIANGTCVSFCNQPKATFGYLTRVTPVCRCLHPFCGRSIWLRQESLRHILASPGIIAVNVIWIKRGFNACKTPRCIPIYLRPFPSNSTLKFQKFAILAHFCTFWPPLGTPLGQSR